MHPELKKAEYVGGYKIRLEFSDGTAGTIDPEGELWGEVFEPLKKPETFRQFSIHPELRTIHWPNDADFAPEFLYETAARQVVEADT